MISGARLELLKSSPFVQSALSGAGACPCPARRAPRMPGSARGTEGLLALAEHGELPLECERSYVRMRNRRRVYELMVCERGASPAARLATCAACCRPR